MANNREFICVVCGGKGIDNSRNQTKKFCSDRCKNKLFNKARPAPVVEVCIYNDGVDCMDKQCDRCGWNPAVAAMRKEKQRQKGTDNGENEK